MKWGIILKLQILSPWNYKSSANYSWQEKMFTGYISNKIVEILY